MSVAWNSVSLLVAILLSSPESGTSNITAFTSSPFNPSYTEEGNNFTLEWTYTLDGTVGLAQFSIDNDGTDLLIGKKFSTGVIPVEPKYRLRFRAQVSDIRAELNILAVRRSDEATYKLNVSPTGSGTLGQVVVVIVKFPPSITEISGNQTVNERENATLQCRTDGKPTPNTTWTRDSDNSVVNMPLTDIRREDAGKYRCTADNGIKGPATEDVWIVVQYPVEVTGLGENVTVPQGGEQTFSCPVDGIPKPNISWYRDGEVGEIPIFTGEKLEVRENGCYTCVASNSLGNPVTITQCLIVEEEESSMSSTSPTSTPKGPNRTIIGVVVGVAVFVVIVSGLMTWWACKKKECLKHSKNEELDYVAVDQINNG